MYCPQLRTLNPTHRTICCGNVLVEYFRACPNLFCNGSRLFTFFVAILGMNYAYNVEWDHISRQVAHPAVSDQPYFPARNTNTNTAIMDEKQFLSLAKNLVVN